MNRYKKAGILTAVLGVPVLLLLFLYTSNENSFDIGEVYFADGKFGDTPGQPHTVADFVLSDQKGAEYAFQKGKDKLFVVNFFFTRCGSFCPAVTNSLLRVQDRFTEEAPLDILSISVDPEFDQAKQLADYAQAYDINYGQWKLLTGKKEEIYRIILEEFMLPVQDSAVAEHDFIHSDRIVLVDALGRIRGYYYGQDQEDVDRLIGEIKVLLSSETNGFND